MSEEKKVAVIACAGMEKSFGSVAMLSVFKAVEELRPDETVLVALPPLLTGVAAHVDLVKKSPVIVVDGCAERCATKSVAKMGGKIGGRILVIDSVKKYGLTPDSASHVGSKGEKLAERIAEEVALLVDKALGRKTEN
jgi:uncharacterized metal-binding protein